MPAEIPRTILLVLGTYLVHSTLLLGGLWIVDRFFPVRSYALRERLWRLAVLAPLVTATVQLTVVPPATRIPCIPIDEALAEPSGGACLQGSPRFSGRGTARGKQALGTGAVWQQPGGPAGDALPAGRHVPAGAAARLGDGSRGQGKAVATSRGDAGVGRGPSGGGLAGSGLWASAAVVMLLAIIAAGAARLGWLLYVFRTGLARCRPYGGPGREVLDSLVRAAGCRRRVWLLEWAGSQEPAAAGVFRWRILVPRSAACRLPGDEWRALLGHELAHLVRADPLWRWIGRVLCTCGAFQPLHFVAARRLRQAAEFRCDAWAVRHGVSPLALAACLTRMAEWTRSGHAATAALPGGRGQVTQRVERLLGEEGLSDRWDRPGRRRLAGVLAALALVASCRWLPGLPGDAPPARAEAGEFARVDAKDLRPPRPESPTRGPEWPRQLRQEILQLDGEIAELEAAIAEWEQMAGRSPAAEGLSSRIDGLVARAARVRRLRETLTRYWTATLPFEHERSER